MEILSLENLFQQRPEGASVLIEDRDGAVDRMRSLAEASRVIFRLLDGDRCENATRFLDRLGTVMELTPFGKNWDALDECMRDREFRPRESTVLVIQHADRVLVRHPSRVRMIWKGIMHTAAQGRSVSGYAHFEASYPYPPLWTIMAFDDFRLAAQYEDSPWVTKLIS